MPSRARESRWIRIGLAASAGLALGMPGRSCGTHFVEEHMAAGLDHEHRVQVDDPLAFERSQMAAGVAAGDFDGDGWVDLFVVGGNRAASRLYRNRGDGRFEDVAAGSGLVLTGEVASGPLFVDLDEDDRPDLFVGGVAGAPTRLYRNLGEGRFEERTESMGFGGLTLPTLGAGGGDYDRDGDLDLVLAHWGVAEPGDARELLWRNEGGRFQDAGRESGLAAIFPRASTVGPGRFVFAPSFSDVDGDGWPDLLVVGDFGTTQLLRNDGSGRFEDATDPEIVSDENGMGSAIADLDNDGDLDWFVTSIWDSAAEPAGNWGTTGNRLYRNEGSPGGRLVLRDVTEAAGVRRGDWGWGACAADFDLDGDLDLYHGNGWTLGGPPFDADASRLFANDGHGRFVEVAEAWEAVDTGASRGVVCFDYDRDGDVDVFVANHSGPPSLFRNELERRPGAFDRHWLIVRLEGLPGNAHGIGARIHLGAGEDSQLRELRAGNQFMSQAPAEAHFGLRARRRARLEVRWPDGAVSLRRGLRLDRVVTLRHPLRAPEPDAP